MVSCSNFDFRLRRVGNRQAGTPAATLQLPAPQTRKSETSLMPPGRQSIRLGEFEPRAHDGVLFRSLAILDIRRRNESSVGQHLHSGIAVVAPFVAVQQFDSVLAIPAIRDV